MVVLSGPNDASVAVRALQEGRAMDQAADELATLIEERCRSRDCNPAASKLWRSKIDMHDIVSRALALA